MRGCPRKGRSMPLQNRVDPFGRIHAAAARGMFTGNRGVIHDPDTRSLLRRRWTTKAWIVCDLLHPSGKTRDVFGRNGPTGGAGWSELFFLDEVAALAAGHRPCFYCRRGAAETFRRCFAAANAQGAPAAPEMDALLHGERAAAGAVAPILDGRAVRALPDGAMIAYGDRAFAVRQGRLLAWSFEGYGAAPPSCRSLPDGCVLLTPPATVAALRAGYRPVWHPSAGRQLLTAVPA